LNIVCGAPMFKRSYVPVATVGTTKVDLKFAFKLLGTCPQRDDLLPG